jgi:hypothetical protein
MINAIKWAVAISASLLARPARRPGKEYDSMMRVPEKTIPQILQRNPRPVKSKIKKPPQDTLGGF